jgi:pimeloyl-ACP methyl ester carboxylesterase
LRGYNKSDQPEAVEDYKMEKLVGDVAAVIRHLGREKAVVVGHDWGGAIAWSVAMDRPKMVERLVILNVPHPNGMRRELANNPLQRKNSQYARNFQKPEAAALLTPELLTFWIKDVDLRWRACSPTTRSTIRASRIRRESGSIPRSNARS